MKKPYFLYKENQLIDVCLSKKEIGDTEYDFLTRNVIDIPELIKWDKDQERDEYRRKAKYKSYKIKVEKEAKLLREDRKNELQAEQAERLEKEQINERIKQLEFEAKQRKEQTNRIIEAKIREKNWEEEIERLRKEEAELIKQAIREAIRKKRESERKKRQLERNKLLELRESVEKAVSERLEEAEAELERLEERLEEINTMYEEQDIKVKDIRDAEAVLKIIRENVWKKLG
jgi:hypothetical protein